MPPAALYERQNRYQRRKSSELADIGVIPDVVNPVRRESCRLNLALDLQTYYPQSTGLSPFSADHLRVIARIQQIILEGGRLVEALFRGFAKTTIGENSIIWATKYGHRKFCPLFGSGGDAAEANIDSVKMELAENDLLYEDFPEICHPIRSLEGKPQRCASQTHTIDDVAEPTHIEWTADTIVLPTIRGSVASGAIITARGITAASRGMKHKRADGTQQRPDFVFIDDPQTDESAASPAQVQKRMKIINKNILKLGGHNKRLAVVIAATVIERDDLIDQLLDPKKNPSWQGERISIVQSFAAAHETLWLTEYARIRNTFDADDPQSQKLAWTAATEFYKANRAAMDKGAVPTWEHCYDRDHEISAIQHIYNALIDDGPEVFASEFQNQPLVKESGDTELKADAVQAKAVRIKRGVFPQYVTHLAAFIDVQDKMLFGGVCGFGPGFRGHVGDYVTFPDQKTEYFNYKTAKQTFTRKFAGKGKEAAMRAALEEFSETLMGRTWKREDGAELRVSLCLVDSGDGDHSDIVREFCKRSKFAANLLPSKGRGVKATDAPWELHPKRKGETQGWHWNIAPLPKSPATRLVHIDVNFWKSFLVAGFMAGVGGARSIELFEGKHDMLADHVAAEYGVKVESRGRQVTEFKERPGRDNHFLDVLVGCCVGASILGVKVDLGMEIPRKKVIKQRRASVSYL